jgi:hypothetical protein
MLTPATRAKPCQNTSTSTRCHRGMIYNNYDMFEYCRIAGLKATYILILAVSTIIFCATATAQIKEPTAKERADAVRLWDQVVKAKGGREKLRSISNMMLTKGSNFPNVQIEFYVYPNLYWEWSKGKIVYEYTDASMANLDRGVYLFDPQPENAARLQPVRGGASYRETWLMNACTFLLETKWLQPRPVRIRSAKVGKERLDVIETNFPTLEEYKNWGIDFYIDPESLVVRMAVSRDYKGEHYNEWFFEDFRNVDGIMLPTKGAVQRDLTKWPSKNRFSPLSFQFNVAYDDQLFERAPSVAAGPDAWKPKR